MQKNHLPKSDTPNLKINIQPESLKQTNKQTKILALIERNVLNLIKSIYEKPTANTLSCGRPSVLPKCRNMAKTCTLTTSAQYCTRGSTQCNKARKERASRLEREK